MDEKSTMDHHFTKEELDQMERDLDRVSDETEPCQAERDPPFTQSRYKRGRHWWEQSKWERKR